MQTVLRGKCNSMWGEQVPNHHAKPQHFPELENSILLKILAIVLKCWEKKSSNQQKWDWLSEAQLPRGERRGAAGVRLCRCCQGWESQDSGWAWLRGAAPAALCDPQSSCRTTPQPCCCWAGHAGAGKAPLQNSAAVKTGRKSIAGNHRSTEPMVGAPQVLKGAVGGEAPWAASYICSDSMGWHFLCSNSTSFPNSFYQTVPAKGDPWRSILGFAPGCSTPLSKHKALQKPMDLTKGRREMSSVPWGLFLCEDICSCCHS